MAIWYTKYNNVYLLHSSGHVKSEWEMSSDPHCLVIGILQCAGGLASGLGVRECAVKESQEEASVNVEYLDNLKSVGSVR